jgi:hypothetical protein
MITFKSSADNMKMEFNATMILELSKLLYVVIVHPSESPTLEPII